MTSRRTCVYLLTPLFASLLIVGCSKKNSGDPDRPQRQAKSNANAGRPNAAADRPGGNIAPRFNTPSSTVGQVRGAASRSASQNNLKELAIAMHNYHDTMGRLPAHATYSRDGKPLLSWRVELLPYLNQRNLYNQFKRNEPWDSPHNKPLLAQMPKLYALPGSNDDRTYTTHYQVFTGRNAIFERPFQGRQPSAVKLFAITDGTSNTFMITEAKKPVPWTQPADIDAPQASMQDLGGYLQAAMADASVRRLQSSMQPATLQAAITRNGGEIVNFP